LKHNAGLSARAFFLADATTLAIAWLRLHLVEEAVVEQVYVGLYHSTFLVSTVLQACWSLRSLIIDGKRSCNNLI
jgi:hypothetical protein